MRFFLSLILLLNAVHTVDSATIPSLSESPHRGSLIITEVVLDDDGVYAALPAQGSEATITGFGGNWKHSTDVDLLIELKNVSGSTLDLEGFELMYIVEPYDFASDSTLESTGTAGYDLCGIQSNSSEGYNVQTNTLSSSSGSIPVSPGDFVMIFENPGAGGISFSAANEIIIPKNTVGAFAGGARHQYPVAASDYPANGGSSVGYDRIMLTVLNGFSNGQAPEKNIDGILQGDNKTDSVRRPYSYLGPDDGGVPRTCIGNAWTSDAAYLRDGWIGNAVFDGTVIPDTGVDLPVVSHRFTILLLDDNGNLVDVFSVSRSVSDLNAQSNLSALVNASSQLFDFSSAGPGMVKTADNSGSDIPLNQFGYSKKTLVAASSRDSYVLTGVSLGTFEETTGSGANNEIGDPKFTYDDTLSRVDVLRSPPSKSHIAGQPNGGSEGDPGSQYRLSVKVLDENSTNQVQNVLFKIFRVSEPTLLFPTDFLGTSHNAVTDRWEADFSPDSSSFGFLNISTSYGVLLRISDQLGTKNETMRSGSSTFTSLLTGPVISSFTTIPSLPVSAPQGSAIQVSVEAVDFGTSVLKSVVLSVFNAASAGFVPGEAYVMSLQGNDVYEYSYIIPGSTAVTPGTTYYFQITATDGFGASSTFALTSSTFEPKTSPFLNPSPFPISTVQSRTTTISNLRDITVFDGAGGSDVVTYTVKEFSPLINSCTLDPQDGKGDPQKLVIVSSSTAGTGYCTLTLDVPSAQGISNEQTIIITILQTSDTLLNSFLAAPSEIAANPSAISTRTKSSFSEFVEFQADLFDLDGLNNGSVQLHFVITDTVLLNVAGFPAQITTAYSVFMYDDGLDDRTPSSNANGVIGFGQRYISGSEYVLNDNDRLTNASLITPIAGGETFPPGGATPDFHLFRADLSAPNNDIYHIDLRPNNFSFSTHYRLDLEIEDNNANTTYLQDVGIAAIFAGPGWVQPASNESEFSGTESTNTQNFSFQLFAFECTGPDSVSGQQCGIQIPSQAIHDSLDWTVSSFDTNFFDSIGADSGQTSQDGFIAVIKENRCGVGLINMTITDSQGFQATTDAFSLNITCVDDVPLYDSNYSGAPFPTLLVPEDSTEKTFSLTAIGFELVEGFSETPADSMVWTVHTTSPSVNDGNLTTWFISGPNLKITPNPNFSHVPPATEEIVLCVEDLTGNKPTNGTVTHPDGTGFACIIVPLQVSAFDDSPEISITGETPASPIPSPLVGIEDTTLTTQIGLNDSDGPFTSVNWTASILSDPGSVINTITFSLSAAVGTTGETWTMDVVPNGNAFGEALVLLSVATTASASDSQQVTISFTEVNDQPFINASPCTPSKIITDEGFPEFSLTLSQGVVTDADPASGVPETNLWSLSRVDYHGSFFDVSQNLTITTTGSFIPAANLVNSKVTVDQNATRPLFEIQVSTGGTLTLSSSSFASLKDATMVFDLTDRSGGAGALTTQGVCNLVVNDTGNTPQIDPGIEDPAILTFNEDETHVIELSPFERDPFNPFDAGTFDENLRWSVRLLDPTTLFSENVQYPLTYRAYLQNKNQQAGSDLKIALGPFDPESDTNFTGEDSVPQSVDSPVFLDPVLDRLYIHAAPDVFGPFALQLQLHRLNVTGDPAPATKILTLSIQPVNDTPEITILDPLDPSLDVQDYTFEIHENDSVGLLDLSTWENDARDFVPNKAGGNGPGSKLFWDYPNLSTSDPDTYLLGCPPPASANFLDPVTNDFLCIKPGNKVGGISVKTADLTLKIRDFDIPVPVQREIKVQVNGSNDPPRIANLGTGNLGLSVPEDSPGTSFSLSLFAQDEEEALVVFQDAQGVFHTNIERMEWYFHETLLGEAFSIGTLPSSTSLVQIVTGFGSLEIIPPSDSSPAVLAVTPLSDVALTQDIFMVLCDLGTPLGSSDRLCTSTEVSIIVTNFNDNPEASFPPSLFVTPEGGCISVDLTQFSTDKDQDALTWSIKAGTIKTVTFEDSVFNFPILTLNNNIFEMRPQGQDQSCSLPESAIGALSQRAFGSLTIVFKLTDGQQSVEFGQPLSFTPIWYAPEILLGGQIDAVSGRWELDEDTSLSSPNTLQSLENSTFLSDADWGGTLQGYGETIDDFHWSLLYQGIATDVFTTDSFRLSIETSPGALFQDKILFEPFSNQVTEGVSLTLRVTDSQGLSDEQTITIVINAINDAPRITDFPPTLCNLLGVPATVSGRRAVCMFEDTTTVLDFSGTISDPLDVPPDPLTFSIFSGVPGENFSEGPTLFCSPPTGPDLSFTSSVFSVQIDNSADTFTVSGLLNQNHQSQSMGETLTVCVSDNQAYMSTAVQIYVLPTNDDPIILVPLDGVEFIVSEDSEITTDLVGNDALDGLALFDPGVLQWRIVRDDGSSQQDHIFEPSADGTELVIRPAPEFNSISPIAYTLFLEEILDAGRSASVSFTVSSFPVNDPPSIRELTGNPELFLTVGEDVTKSHLLRDHLAVDDQEGVAPGTHTWSFSDTTVLTEGIRLSPSGNSVRFLLQNPTDVNGAATLLVETTAAETTGVLDGLSLFVLDTAEFNSQTGLGYLSDVIEIGYQFLSENDPPVIQAILPDGDSVKVRKNDSQGVVIDLSSWKIDGDTAQNQLCFDLAGFDRSKVLPFFREGYGPPVQGQTNCTQDLLTIIPVSGVQGLASIQIILFDTVDLNSASYTIPVQIVDPVPQFLSEKLSVASLTFTSDTTFLVPLQDLILDDQSVSTNGLTTLDSSFAGFFILNPSLTDLALVSFESGDLKVDPDYEGFADGSRTFTLFYKDSEDNIVSLTPTVTKKHAFLEWARYDDANGTGNYDAGDRLVLKFSNTSLGATGMTTSAALTTSVPGDLITTTNLVQAIKPMNGTVEKLNSLGLPIRKIEFLDSALRFSNRTAAYMEITLNENSLDPQIDKIRGSGTVSDPTTQSLVYSSGLKPYDRTVNLDISNDVHPPRVISAVLIDRNGDGFQVFKQQDEIHVFASEHLQNLVSSDPLDSFLFSNLVLGTGSIATLEGNRVMITLGTGAQVVPAFFPTLKPKSTLQDLSGNIISNTPGDIDLITTDSRGPTIEIIEYDKRSSDPSLYREGDKLYITFSEPLLRISVPATNLSAELDQAFGLIPGESFGSVPVLEWADEDKVLIITFGSGASGLSGGSSGTKIRISAPISDLSGNQAGEGLIIEDFGQTLPEGDTIAPTLRVELYRGGLELDEEVFDFIGPGLLEIRAVFSDTQNNVPRIKISQGSLVYASSPMQSASFDPSGKQWIFIQNVGVDDGTLFIDGVRVLDIEGENDPISGKDLVFLPPTSYRVDSKPPIFTINPFGQLQAIDGQDKETTDKSALLISGSANEILDSLQVQIEFPTEEVVLSSSLDENRRDFQITVANLQPGDNLIKLLGSDQAGNVGIKTVLIHRLGEGSGSTAPDDPRDRDSDGVLNFEDAFPDNALEQYDTDGDSIGDQADSDDDGDGIPDVDERAVFLHSELTDLSLDSDNDGIPNLFDPDIDADGIFNENEPGFTDPFHLTGRALDTDNDGLMNHEDQDDDSDALTDLQERSLGTNVLNRDTDGDGILDGQDGFPLNPLNTVDLGVYGADTSDFDQDGIINQEDPFPFDKDQDGIPDHIDPDDDNDGILDLQEDILVVSISDFDGDGIDNTLDPFPCDVNQDGIPESSFIGASIPLSLFDDQDNDCIPDSRDEDGDGNNIPDQLEEVLEDEPLSSGNAAVAVPRDAAGNLRVSIPITGLVSEILYDAKVLSEDYQDLSTADFRLAPDSDLVDLVPVIQVKDSSQSILNQGRPSGFETLGKVLSLRGRIKAGKTVKFPFPLPGFLRFQNTLNASDFRLEFFDSDSGLWIQDGEGFEFRSGIPILYAEISHFSEWRVLKSTTLNTSGTLAAVGSSGGGGCFVATAATGNPDSWLVRYFQEFRDAWLLQRSGGSWMMDTYYHYSPPVAQRIESSAILRSLVLAFLIILIPVSFILWNFWEFLALILLLAVAVTLRKALFKF